MKRYFVVISLYLYIVSSFAQSNNQNYISTRTYINGGNQFVETINYYDGLGRPLQTVQKGVTPTNKDLVTLVEYDLTGKESKLWLAKTNNGNGDFVDSETFKSINGTSLYHENSRLYSEIEYDGLGRSISNWSPGTDWENHPIKTEYLTNSTNEVINFTGVYNHNTPVQQGYYAPSTLYKTLLTDQDGKTTTEYKDKLGRVIMQRQGNDVDTYYIYNDLGQLVCVLPPLARYGDDNYDVFNQYAYFYRYDSRGNQTYKKLPGCEPVWMAYDKANRLVLSSDGNQRAKSKPNELLCTAMKYDVFGRLVYTELTKIYSAYSVYDNFINIYKSTVVLYDGEYSSNISKKPLIINYYDDYNFLEELPQQIKGHLIYQEKQGYDKQYSSAKGLLTGTRTYLLDGSGKYTTTAIYYDNRGNVIQTRATNHLEGYDIAYEDLNFNGKPNKMLKEHSTNSSHSNPIIEQYEYTYDHMGRLIHTTTYDNDQLPITLSSLAYDELGRITEKRRHNGENIEQYKYNIQNWITEIKSGTFEEKIYYNNTTGLPNLSGTETHCYNGNISAIKWKYGDKWNGYRYKYDNLNRYDSGISFSTNSTDNAKYSEYFVYDKQGNPIHIERNSPKSIRTDYIWGIEYNGNQITKVTDYGINQNLYNLKEYTDKADMDIEMTYDANGNLTSDMDRGIATINYNILNLPDTIQFDNGNQIINNYDATGQKLRTTYYTRSTPMYVPQGNIMKHTANNYNDYYRQATGYIDNKEYELGQWEYNGEWNKALTKIYNPEGYLSYQSITPRYYYYSKDHLGNIREVWRPAVQGTFYTAGVIQRMQYYPSGLPWYESANPQAQQKKYNGKEWIEAHGYDSYDYHARTYYPAIMRFTTVDPHAYRYPSMSPYSAFANNPLIYIDPDGRDIILAAGLTNKQKLQIVGNLQKLTNDRIVYKTLKDGTTQIKIASLGEGNKTAGTRLIRRLNSSDKTVTIDIGAVGSGNSEVDVNSANAINGKGTDTKVSFDPTSDPSIMTEDSKTGNVSGKKRPNQVGLAHELIHAERSMRGEAIDYSENGTYTYKDASGKTVTQTVPKEELGTVGLKYNKKKDITENQIRKEQGQNKRGAY